MALVGDPAPILCYDDEPFIDISLTGIEIGRHENLHHPQQLMEECMVGIHQWPSSSSPSSSSVVTFDGHGEECCAAWMDDADQLSYVGLEPGHAAVSSMTSNCFRSFGGDSSGGRDVTAAGATQKRPHAYASSQRAEEEAVAALKKHCGGNRRAATNQLNKVSTPRAPKDHQNLAAKNCRERISERLRALQELVPNGSKVDTVTMLDKAISYVKFMQLQLKVLETDAFWPAPGGKAPKMSQVKEALDAILFSAPFS